jgi:hypothetical protein
VRQPSGALGRDNGQYERIPNAAGATGCAGSAHEAGRGRKSDDGGRELFSGIHFGMDDWGNWRLNEFAV